MDLQRNDFSNWLKQIKNFNESFRRNSIPRIVITDASSSVTRSLIYRLIYDEVFGINQEVIINLYESSDKSTFLNSLIIEISACAPHNLKGTVLFEILYFSFYLLFLFKFNWEKKLVSHTMCQKFLKMRM